MEVEREHWLSRAPKMLAFAHALTARAYMRFVCLEDVIDILLRALEPDRLVPTLPHVEENVRDVELAIPFTMFSKSVFELDQTTREALDFFSTVEEQFGAVAQEPVEYIFTREHDNPARTPAWRIVATSWHSMFLQLATETAGAILHRLDVERFAIRARGERAWLIWSSTGGRIEVEHIMEACKAQRDDLPSRLQEIHFPPFVEAMKLKVRLEQEVFRAWKQHYAENGEFETAGNDPELQERYAAFQKYPKDRELPVSVDITAGTITVDGIVHARPAHHCQIVWHLCVNAGKNVTGPELQKLPGCKAKRIWKQIQEIEKAIPAIRKYINHEGNKGYRLVAARN